MQINKITIKNFRPIGGEGLEISLARGCTTIVGENNVGKSSIFQAVKAALSDNYPWTNEDWHQSDVSKAITIQFDVDLDDEKLSELKDDFLQLSFLNLDEFKNIFSSHAILEFERKNSGIYKLYFAELIIINSFGYYKVLGSESYSEKSWEVIIGELKTKSKNIRKLMEDRQNKIEHHPMKFKFNRDFTSYIHNLITKNILILEEFREKPSNNLEEVFQSSSGKELANVLFTLKNARHEQNQYFFEIKRVFGQLFPNMELDVISEHGEIKLLITKFNLESTTNYLGVGILESIFLLTHIIAHRNKLLLVDHPETHLHPHAQRRISTLIDGTKDSKIVIITHSPIFINISKSNSVIRIVQDKVTSQSINPSCDLLSDIEYMTLGELLDNNTKDLFFSRKVILVEGSTEIGVLPLLLQKMGYNCDENSVSIIDVGGKNNFKIFSKICEMYKLPYLIIADNDAQSLIDEIKSICPNCKEIILPQEFDDLLPTDLREEGERLYGRSKPRVGKYVARKILERNEKIPDSLTKLLNSIINF